MERLPVVLALTPPAERSIEHLLFGRTAILEPRASATEAAELEQELALAETPAVLLSADLPGLTAADCARARAQGARVTGLARDAFERQQLHALGVDEVIEPTDPEQTVLAALRGTPPEAEAPVITASEQLPAQRAPLRRTEATGSVLVVLGSKGAPGSSECAASLAALAAARWPCVLVELDALGGGLDLRLAADARQGSLLGLARAVAAGDAALGELLERWLTRKPGWPPVLIAPPDPAEWVAELANPGATGGVLRALAASFPLAVIDCGFLLTDGETTSPASRIHREAVVTADAVLLVLGAREQQLRAALSQLDTLLELGVPPERLRVVLNGVRGPGAVARSTLEPLVAAQLAERRFALDATLAWDGRALAGAQRTGLPLAQTRSRGAYKRGLEKLLEQLFLPVAPAPRERKLRLVPPASPPSPSLELDEAEEVALPWRS